MYRIDLSAAQRAVAELKSWDLRETSIDVVKAVLAQAIVGLRIKAPRFQRGLRLFRSRAMVRPVSGADLWHPPIGTTKLGRANREKEVIFYATATRDSAIFEIQPKAGDTIGVGIWETTTDLRVAHIGYFPAVFGRLGSVRETPPWATHPQGPEVDPSNLELVEMIENAFTQHVGPGDEHLYKISVAVAEIFLSSPDIDAITYPTLRMSGNTDNVALKPKVAERALRFAGAEFLRVESLLDPGYSLALLDRADELDADGAIQWKGGAAP